MRVISQGIVAAAFVLFACCVVQGDTTARDGGIELFGIQFGPSEGKYYSTGNYTYFYVEYDDGGRGDGLTVLRLSVRSLHISPGDAMTTVEGIVLLYNPLQACSEKGYIDAAALAVQFTDHGCRLFGKVVVRTAPCGWRANFHPTRSTVTVDLYAVESPEMLSYFNERFFELFPERETWKGDLTSMVVAEPDEQE